MTPTAGRLAELSAPAGNADLGGALAKGAALAATAAVLAVGTGIVPLPRHLAQGSKAAVQALGIAPATAEAQASRPSSVATPGGKADESGELALSHAGHRASDSRGRSHTGTMSAPGARARPLRVAGDEHGFMHTSGERSRDSSGGDGGSSLSGEGDSLRSGSATTGHDSGAGSDASTPDGSSTPGAGPAGHDGSGPGQSPPLEPQPSPTSADGRGGADATSGKIADTSPPDLHGS
jgi:hypothetical protein